MRPRIADIAGKTPSTPPFENRDGSWNLRFDYFPSRLEHTTIQLRDFDAKEE